MPRPRKAFVDVPGAVDRSGRAVKGGIEAVTRGVVLLSPPGGEGLPDQVVVPLGQLLPIAIAKTRLMIGGVDNVGEHDGREDRVRHDGPWLKADEPRDRVQTRAVYSVDVNVAPHPTLLAEHLDPSVGHERRDVFCLRVILGSFADHQQRGRLDAG